VQVETLKEIEPENDHLTPDEHQSEVINCS